MKDFWFVFDAVLAALMILETWIMPLRSVLFATDGGEGGGDDILRYFFCRAPNRVRLMNYELVGARSRLSTTDAIFSK